MKEMTRTLIFAVVAVLAVTSAVISNQMSRPKPLQEFAKVGQEFYPDFQDISDAASLEVVALDPDTSEVRRFRVELKDGLWRIPTHHDYPADAADQLARTASSVIGLTREALAGRRTNEHERYGVVDPASETLADPEAAGRRITLTRTDGTVLADYIIGKRVEDVPADQSVFEPEPQVRTMYYVRRADEPETFRVQLDLKVSARFADWIEPDLLKLRGEDLVALTVRDYTLEEQRREVRQGPFVFEVVLPARSEEEVTQLLRDQHWSPWQLEGLDEETEELQTEKVRRMVSTLDDLRIVGVRPKLKVGGRPVLTADLEFDPPAELRQNEAALESLMQRVSRDLQRRGFALAMDDDQEGRLQLISDKGELVAATNDGVVYHLYFGNVFIGDEKEIQVGGEESDENAAEPAVDEGDEAAGEEGVSRSRYLFVRASFDAAHLGEVPQKPEEPVKPTPPEPAAEKDNDNDEAGKADEAEAESPAAEKADAEKTGDSPAQSESRDESPAASDDAAAGSEAEKPEAKPETVDPQKAYEEALEKYEGDMVQYRRDLERYEQDRQQYEERMARGQETVQRLNERFADWFYVISARSFDDLHLSRAELIRPKEKPAEPAAEEKSEEAPAPPESDGADETKPAEAKPEPKPEDARAGDEQDKAPAQAEAGKPAAEAKPADKPAQSDGDAAASPPAAAPEPEQPRPQPSTPETPADDAAAEPADSPADASSPAPE